MSSQSTIPLTHDMDWIIRELQLAFIGHYGYVVTEEGYILKYRGEDFETIQSILDSYDTAYVEVLKPRMLKEVTDIRWEKQQIVPDFGGAPLPADDITVGRIIAALELMDRNEDLPRTRNWKVTEGVWAELSYETLNAMGRAIGMHIQACFDNEKALFEDITEAETVTELLEIDVNSGWPE